MWSWAGMLWNGLTEWIALFFTLSGGRFQSTRGGIDRLNQPGLQLARRRGANID